MRYLHIFLVLLFSLFLCFFLIKCGGEGLNPESNSADENNLFDSTKPNAVPTENSGENGRVNSAKPNTAPIARSGEKQTLFTGETVILHGAASTDAEDDFAEIPLTYYWQQTDSTGYAVELDSTDVANPTFITPEVTKTVVLTFELTVTDSGLLTAIDTVEITVKFSREEVPATDKLNDTGITACAIGSENNLACPIDNYPSQNSEYDSDVQAVATLTKVDEDKAKFDFTKLDENGNSLPADASQWSCVQDNVTGLIWEVKTNDGGLHDNNNTYTWYNSDADTNGGLAGFENSGNCSGSDCDTQNYVLAVNQQALCGISRWRMPIIEELHSFVNDISDPSIDTDYFKYTKNSLYWSGSTNENNTLNAWNVLSVNGKAYTREKYFLFHVRLVSAGQ